MNIFEKIQNNPKLLTILKFFLHNHHASETCMMLALTILLNSSGAINGRAFANDEKDSETMVESSQTIDNVISKDLINEIFSRVSDFIISEAQKRNPTIPEKIEYILEHHDLTMDQFRELNAIVLAEAKKGSYVDAYHTINIIYNRANCDCSFRNEYGSTIYQQATYPGQFEVYEKGGYLDFVNIDFEKLTLETIGSRAVIDFLYNQAIVHDNLSFVGNSETNSPYKQEVPYGNRYGNPVNPEDRLNAEEETRITNEELFEREAFLLEIIEREENRRDSIEIPIYEDSIVQIYTVIDPYDRTYNIAVPKSEQTIYDMNEGTISYINNIASEYDAYITENISNGISRTRNKTIQN